jgi:hypothetical protein
MEYTIDVAGYSKRQNYISICSGCFAADGQPSSASNIFLPETL